MRECQARLGNSNDNKKERKKTFNIKGGKPDYVDYDHQTKGEPSTKVLRLKKKGKGDRGRKEAHQKKKFRTWGKKVQKKSSPVDASNIEYRSKKPAERWRKVKLQRLVT